MERSGPFQIIEVAGTALGDSPIIPPRRRYSCENYETCLGIACALNWGSFTCRGCNGQVNELMLWRAHQAKRRDGVANALAEIPELTVHSADSETPQVVKVVNKR